MSMRSTTKPVSPLRQRMIEAIKEQQREIDAPNRETDTQKLCIGSGTTKTCITQEQLATLLANQSTRKTQ
jgi:hypothetical protein